VEYRRGRCSDKTLVEFIIDIAQHSDKVEAFDQVLKKNGAEIFEYFLTHQSSLQSGCLLGAQIFFYALQIRQR
jgi:hypothetical protein